MLIFSVFSLQQRVAGSGKLKQAKTRPSTPLRAEDSRTAAEVTDPVLVNGAPDRTLTTHAQTRGATTPTAREEVKKWESRAVPCPVELLYKRRVGTGSHSNTALPTAAPNLHSIKSLHLAFAYPCLWVKRSVCQTLFHVDKTHSKAQNGVFQCPPSQRHQGYQGSIEELLRKGGFLHTVFPSSTSSLPVKY